MIDVFNSGGPIMIPLLICSFVSLTVILERSLFWFSTNRGRHTKEIEEVLGLCSEKRWKKAEELSAESRDFVLRVINHGLHHRETALTKAMESKAFEELAAMRHRMGILDTIITAAPLLGIFGTVLGIIVSFDLLGAGIKDPSAITGGISQALITTASGLGIAILTLLPYNYLNTRVDQAVQQIEHYATRLEIIYESSLKPHRTVTGSFAGYMAQQKVTNETYN